MNNRNPDRRNFMITFHDPDIKYGFKHPNDFLDTLSGIERGLKPTFLTYLCFQGEVTPDGEDSKSHYQMYLEFSKKVSFKHIQRELFTFGGITEKVHIDSRRGSQKQAINYCSNRDPLKKKELVILGFFEGGSPKREYSQYDSTNPDNPFDEESQGISIRERIKNGTFKVFEDVAEKEFPFLAISNESKLVSLFDRYSVIDSNIQPLKIFYLYGESNVGKTAYGEKLIRDLNLGYTDSDMKYITISDYSSGALRFLLRDEGKKVLFMLEVNGRFPREYGEFTNIIERKGRLRTLGGSIRNTFEVLVIQSTIDPYTLCHKYGKDEGFQLLRRFLDRTNKVIHIHKLMSDLDDDLEEREKRLALNGFIPQEEYDEGWFRNSVITEGEKKKLSVFKGEFYKLFRSKTNRGEIE